MLGVRMKCNSILLTILHFAICSMKHESWLQLCSSIGLLYRREALKMWKKMYGFKATYEELLNICVQKSKLNCAEKIVKLLGAPDD